MLENFADRLLEAIERKGSPVCVGLDPVFDRLPAPLKTLGPVEAVETFCGRVLQIVAPLVPAVKIQSAYFEALGAAGVGVYFRMMAQARKLGLIAIGDVKRNDIGPTAEAYARGHLAGPDAADAITVNGYLGSDGIEPFIAAAAAGGAGIFVLVRTSNPSAPQVQDIRDEQKTPVYDHMARLVAKLGGSDGRVGRRGYSCVGAVVGATYPDEARALRQVMPQQIVLIPGYGAQGASAADCAASFKADGTGGIVNASRSVIFAYQKNTAGAWEDAVGYAATEFAKEIAEAVKRK
ncbi:MAG: orotidine-5'-phosphate decarboxylase [Planctomycetaceae bacterium]|nr:orotidine-5'-phosphate decarboxylase [Planctomycetaceae bacterium]